MAEHIWEIGSGENESAEFTMDGTAEARYGVHYVMKPELGIWFTAADWDYNLAPDRDPIGGGGQYPPGTGFKVFPDANSPSDTAEHDKVAIYVSGAPPGWKVKLKVIDVDDPTLDQYDVDPDTNLRVVDDTDSISQHRGSDNKGTAGCFVSNGQPELVLTADENGDVKVGQGENAKYPELKVSMKPGDNYRVAAVAIPPESSNNFTDMNVLQVTDPSANGYVGPNGERPKKFAGVITPLLTVWRRLNLEIDSMEAVPDPKPAPDHVTLTVDHVSGNTIYAIGVTEGTDLDFYENGKVVKGSQEIEIEGSFTYYFPEESTEGGVIELKAPPTGFAPGNQFEVFDDDDKYFDKIQMPGALPKDNEHAEITAGLNPKFAVAYIEVVDVNAQSDPITHDPLNRRARIPFELNTYSGGDVASARASKDLTGTDSYWVRTVVLCYQPDYPFDRDPNSEFTREGSTPYIALVDTNYGYSIVYVEAIRDATFWYLESKTWREELEQPARDAFRRQFYGAIAHEVGHLTAWQGADADHQEGGIMEGGELPSISDDFSPATIKRFRYSTTKW